MSSGKKDFFGKEVTDAIREACKKMQVPQEELEIEIVETGSMGIFGLIRKKAHIRVAVKTVSVATNNEEQEEAITVLEPVPEEAVEAASPEPVKEIEKEANNVKVEETKGRQSTPPQPPREIRPESVETVRQELSELLRLMGFPSEVTAELDGATVHCQVNGEHEEALTGQEGKIIDSMQYLLRKLIARKVEEKVRLAIDIGEFREKRKLELMERAKELAALVKEDGKTQAIPPLNPSERRIVHVALQDDKEIRSRSVGDGLFKKILIYKPGKGKKPNNGKRSGGRGKRGRGNKPKENSDS